MAVLSDRRSRVSPLSRGQMCGKPEWAVSRSAHRRLSRCVPEVSMLSNSKTMLRSHLLPSSASLNYIFFCRNLKLWMMLSGFPDSQPWDINFGRMPDELFRGKFSLENTYLMHETSFRAICVKYYLHKSKVSRQSPCHDNNSRPVELQKGEWDPGAGVFSN